jgi:hypothetical protein
LPKTGTSSCGHAETTSSHTSTSYQNYHQDEQLGDSRVVALAGLLGLIFSAMTTTLIVAIIAWIYHPVTDLSGVSSLFIPPPAEFFPEPTERVQYIAATLIFPIALISSTALAYRWLGRSSMSSDAMRNAYNWLLGAFLALALGLAALLAIGNNAYLNESYFYKNPWVAAGALAVIAFLMVARPALAKRAAPVFRFLTPLSYFLAISVIATIILLPIMDRYTINEDPIYTDHFNAVFHAVVQVYLGKALLVDLVHQYGLYPHFLEPVFRVTGLSVFRFTVVMGILTGVSFIAVFLFLKEFLRSKTVLFLGFCTFAFYSYLVAQMHWFDPFFQGQPIRTLFPCLIIYAAWRYFSSGKRIFYYGTFVMGALAILWNFDTGLVAFAAWLLTLFYQELGRGSTRRIIRAQAVHLATGIAVFSAVILVFAVYIGARYGAFPDFGQILAYQKIFYIYGFYMQPMPGLHPWNIVVLVYMLGLMFAVRALVARKVTARSKMLFLLSVLGVGVFSYYQGRSDDAVLTYVWYPAILLLIIFTDDLWAYTRVARRDYLRIALLTLMLFLFSSSVFNIFADTKMEELENIAESRATAAGPTPVSNNADFIKSRVEPGGQVLILSYNSGVYYLESRTTSPLATPGSSEILLRKDYEAIYGFIAEGRGDKIYFDQNLLINGMHDWDDEDNKALFTELTNRYDKVANSANGEIILFGRREQSPDYTFSGQVD